LHHGLIFLLWPFEWPAIIYLFLPIFMPVVIALKYDLIWFGALVAVNLQTAFLSPPVAMSAYYLKAVVPDWDLKTIYRGMADFMVLQVIALLLLMLFPEIALWFPRWLFGKERVWGTHKERDDARRRPSSTPNFGGRC
jgi:TRAP-type mannitol/chloroaromatic compound transport system permease large subunit